MKRANLAGLLLLPACRSLYEDAKKPIPDPDLENISIARSQFDDIPVPDGLRLRTDALASYSYQCGSFRQGSLIYEGPTDPGRVAAYLRDRLPLHGWSATTEAVEKGGRHLEFTKGRSRLVCEIARNSHRPSGSTVLLVSVGPLVEQGAPSAKEG